MGGRRMRPNGLTLGLVLLGLLLAGEAVPFFGSSGIKSQTAQDASGKQLGSGSGQAHGDAGQLHKEYEDHRAMWDDDGKPLDVYPSVTLNPMIPSTLDEERENFARFDKDGDEGVTMDEWLHVMLDGADPASASGRRWQSQHADADADSDGRLSWEEWHMMLFAHEDPQKPTYIDGHSADAISPVDEDTLLSAFEAADKDRDEQLDRDELLELLQRAHAEHLEHHGHASEAAPDDAFDLSPLAGEVMADLDADRNGRISSGEWLKYGSRTHDAVDRELYDAVAREED